MEIAQWMLFPRPLNIVCSNDGFIGFFGLMSWLMRQIGCVATQKYVSDLRLVQDMEYCLKNLKSSVLMYPEAGYSFDGTATTLPRKFGILLKKLDVPVVMIESEGIFSRNPLYNELQIRKNAKISATMRLLYTREDIREKSVQELSEGIENAFGFDQFAWQKENGIEIHDSFRADGLNRILYKCPHCGEEGKMEGKGIHLTCHDCGKQWELTENGFMKATEGETEIDHIPDWYNWEREELRREITEGNYKGFDVPCDIMMIMDSKSVYCVGEGRIAHDMDGFHLTGCDGKLDYRQSSKSMYTCESAFHWYEIGDVIGIGNHNALYFAMPKEDKHVVCKARLAVEEIYKIIEAEKEARKAQRDAERAAAKAEEKVEATAVATAE
jgi:hypothetical protein